MNDTSTKSVTANPSPNYPTFRSEDLFGQSKVIVIVHGGREYQLRVTRANKLILTA
jgi:hemin uptake protein HemP